MADLQNPNHDHTPTTDARGTLLASAVTGLSAVSRGAIAPYIQIRLCVVP